MNKNEFLEELKECYHVNESREWSSEGYRVVLDFTYLQCGDYCTNCLVGEANVEYISENFAFPGLEIDSGHYNSRSIRVWIDELDEECEEYQEFADIVCGLEDYPLIDEELHSQLMEDYVYYAMADVYYDIVREVGEVDEKFAEYLENIEVIGFQSALIRRLEKETNTYWENTSGSEVWIDVARLSKALIADPIMVEEVLSTVQV